MERRSAIFRLKSPSIRARNAENYFHQRMAEFLGKRVNALNGALITIVKSEGSSLVPGRFALIIPDDPTTYPTEHDVLDFEEGEGSMTVVVKDRRLDNPDIAAQAEALRVELAGGQA